VYVPFAACEEELVIFIVQPDRFMLDGNMVKFSSQFPTEEPDAKTSGVVVNE